MIHHGDCLEVMAGMPEASVDAIVTDPPAGISFMSKDWDHDKGGRTQWVGWMTEVMRQCHRVLKPGGWLVCWAIPRRQHWTMLAIEDAHFLITDVVLHCFASGFPKGRAQLKPAYEPWVLARKPGPLRPLAIDACRIGTTKDVPASPSDRFGANGIYNTGLPALAERDGMDPNTGRWPANVVLTDPIFDGGWEGVVGGGEAVTHPGTMRNDAAGNNWFGPDRKAGTVLSDGDSGTYSRFFLIPKAARADREPVDYSHRRHTHPDNIRCAEAGEAAHPRTNSHPTVKPVELMRHLVRLVTPQGGTCLDPFLGSGTTGIAAEMEGFAWIGIEREAEYVQIAEARLAGVQKGLGLDVPAPTTPRATGGSLEEIRARGGRHAVNDISARSHTSSMAEGLAKKKWREDGVA